MLLINLNITSFQNYATDMVFSGMVIGDDQLPCTLISLKMIKFLTYHQHHILSSMDTFQDGSIL